MQSTAKTIEEYLNELPEERKEAFLKLNVGIRSSTFFISRWVSL